MVFVKSSKYKEQSSLKKALIEEVRKYPILYDEDAKGNASQRANCWALISNAVGVKVVKDKDLADLKTLWKDIRDSFRRCRVEKAGGKDIVWELWDAMSWFAPFQRLNLEAPAKKKPKQERAMSSSNVPSDDEQTAEEPPQQQQNQQANLLEEVVYVEPAPDPRMDQLLEKLEKHLAVDSTPNVHMGHALGQRVDQNVPVNLQNEAWTSIFGVLKQFERDAAPTLAEATGNLTENNDDIGEPELIIADDE